MRVPRQAVIACLTLLALPARAQTDGQVWANMLVQGKITGDLLFHFDTSFRFGDDATRLEQSLVRGALGTRLGKGITVHAGYVHVRTNPANRPSTVEHRPWQQLAFPLVSGERTQLLSRTRLEQRWTEGEGGMSLRARQLLRLNVSLGDREDPRFVLWHEAFLTLTEADWSPDTGFDQHRSFIGLAFPMGPHALEVGAFQQRFPQPAPDRVNSALNVTLVANF
jgi:hypothetical protein